MFRIIQPNTWYADPHGAPCKILRATHEVVHYIRNGRTCIASMGRFQHEFEPLTKAQAERIAEEIETAEHLKRLRAMRAARGEIMQQYETGSSLQLRNLIRQRHAEWSEKTFGNVGPIGPLKHLSKEALEAADDVGDLSEWADMQFLLWDAQRRAGISDQEITAAMEEKLKVNMAREWPEPKDGEPRLHIKL